MLPKSHRLIGLIRIEAPVPDMAGGEDDDSTIGGLFARFAQRSLLADGNCLSRLSVHILPRSPSSPATTGSPLRADLQRLLKDLQEEFETMSEVLA